MKLYIVILCGGSGTRLWPLSRRNNPKHLIPFINGKSLLDQTVERVCQIDFTNKKIVLSTTKQQLKLIPQNLKEQCLVIPEPKQRNTGPAILYCCMKIKKIEPEAIIAFLPADPFIPETKKYLTTMNSTIAEAATNKKIVTLGLVPKHPATGYGYIQGQKSSSKTIFSCNSAYDVAKFHEKPNLKTAKNYMQRDDMFWNLGTFIGQVDVFIKEYSTHAPEMFKTVEQQIENGKGYDQSASISIDYAVMEKSKKIQVVPCDFEWDDVGTLTSFLSIQQQHEDSFNEIINIDGSGNMAKTTKKIVSFVGVNNLCLVETEDSIVVVNKVNIEKVREVPLQLKKKQLDSCM
jgi:mannose-1-phosphate guanylyltransferase